MLQAFKYSQNQIHTIKIKNEEIYKAKDELKKLEGIIPICLHCKEIRDDSGAWHQLESYIADHSEAVFSHGICEKCLEKHHPNFYKKHNSTDETPSSRTSN